MWNAVDHIRHQMRKLLNFIVWKQRLWQVQNGSDASTEVSAVGLIFIQMCTENDNPVDQNKYWQRPNSIIHARVAGFTPKSPFPLRICKHEAWNQTMTKLWRLWQLWQSLKRMAFDIDAPIWPLQWAYLFVTDHLIQNLENSCLWQIVADNFLWQS